jgi:hypothetical protein
MSLVADKYTDSLVNIWSQFRKEIFPELFPDPFSAEDSSEMKGPSETLEDLWSRARSEKLGSRGETILARVRDWLHGAKQSARGDREHVEGLFARCSDLAELAHWRVAASSQREQIFDQLLRTLSGLSGTIHNQKPRTKTGVEFTILWQKDGDGHGHWESEPTTRAFSLTAATLDVADLHGHFSAVIATAVTKQILHDLRIGDLVLPLLVPSRAAAEQTWLRPISPGDDAGQGLVLPERVPSVEDEMALRQAAPRVWRVYNEALEAAVRVHMELIPDWDDIDVPAEAEPLQAPAELAALCVEIEEATAMSRQAVGRVVGTPLKMISLRSTNLVLKRQARSSLALLHELLSK